MTAAPVIELPRLDEVDQPTLLDKLRGALVDAGGLDDIPEPEALIRDLLYRNSTAWLIGLPGNGKSFVALDFAGCVGTGEPWQGCRVERGTVLYVVAEGLSGVRQRVRAWEASMGRPMTGVQFLPVAVQAANGPEWQTFVDLAAELRPALIVIDTQARVTVGLEENSAKDMGEFVQRVEQLRVATGACVLVVHHQGRSGEHMRGSTALEGAATTIIRVKKDDDLVTIECQKQKDAPEFGKITLRLVSHDSSAILALTDPTSGGEGVRAFGKEWIKAWWERFESESVSAAELIKAGVVPEATFHRDKYSLVKAGFVAKEGTESRPRYRLVRQP
ncbi:AAA family ATPase [Micromonospora sp. NPDC049033]|uniref:AAA family ATPase n=1 Tax=Micromonospora sp. NPDC049033 TaxID=3155149 RepID=UPI0033D12C90